MTSKSSDLRYVIKIYALHSVCPQLPYFPSSTVYTVVLIIGYRMVKVIVYTVLKVIVYTVFSVIGYMLPNIPLITLYRRGVRLTQEINFPIIILHFFG